MEPPARDPRESPHPHPHAGELTRTTFAVLFIGALLAVSLLILRPFLGPMVWATMVVVATWPLMRRIERRLGGRRGPAVAVMTAMLLLLFVVPLTLAIVTIVDNVDRMVGWAQMAAAYRMPHEPPAWLAGLPLVGGLLERLWGQATALGMQDLLPRLSPYAGDLTRWLAAQLGSVGMLLLQFLLTVLIAALLYAAGEPAVSLTRRFAYRLGGERAVDTVALAGGAIRGVALGVGITAVVQAVLAGGGLALAGVPFAGLLTALCFMLCIAQIGVIPVLLPAAIWLFWGDHTGWGIFMLVWAGVVAMLDNVLRPVLIRMGADLPLLLIFAGVIGGLLAFGLVGIFVGPVVLAVAYTLLEAWMGAGPPPRAGGDGPA